MNRKESRVRTTMNFKHSKTDLTHWAEQHQSKKKLISLVINQHWHSISDSETKTFLHQKKSHQPTTINKNIPFLTRWLTMRFTPWLTFYLSSALNCVCEFVWINMSFVRFAKGIYANKRWKISWNINAVGIFKFFIILWVFMALFTLLLLLAAWLAGWWMYKNIVAE